MGGVHYTLVKNMTPNVNLFIACFKILPVKDYRQAEESRNKVVPSTFARDSLYLKNLPVVLCNYQ